MDNNTYEVRLANRQSIVKQCSSRTEGQTGKIMTRDQRYQRTQCYYWQRKAHHAAVGYLPGRAGGRNQVLYTFNFHSGHHL